MYQFMFSTSISSWEVIISEYLWTGFYAGLWYFPVLLLFERIDVYLNDIHSDNPPICYM